MKYDVDEARRWIVPSARAGCKLSQARCYQEDWPDSPDGTDVSKAVALLEELYDKQPDHPRVLGGLGWAYGSGHSSGRGRRRASPEKLYERGAALNDPTSIFNLTTQRDDERTRALPARH